MSTTVRTAFEDYRFAITRLSPRTQSDYISKLTVFVEWCEQEGIGLSQFRQATIRRFIESVSLTLYIFGRKGQQAPLL